ncbi:MAG: hypothetical protein FJ260_05025 [Planctomycetes bacterium]|nr:hypothetical protein [Planctomycetota bacterium]
MSDERTVASGERRIERIRAERGMPVRRAPIAAGALVGGAFGAWAAGMPVCLLGVVRDGMSGAGSTAPLDGGGEVRSLVIGVAAACALPLAGGALGAVLGALVQTGGRLRWVQGWGGARNPARGAGGGASGRLAWAAAGVAAATLAVAAGWPRLAAIPAMPLQDALGAASTVVLDTVLAAVAACVAVALADVALARWRWERGTRMSPEEAREELRRTDGDPALRSRRLRAAQRNAGVARGRELHGRAA